MATGATRLLAVDEILLARMTDPLDPPDRLAQHPLLQLAGRCGLHHGGNVPGVAIWVFLLVCGIARTVGAADVGAVWTDLLAAKLGLASMAGAVDALAGGLVDQVLGARPRGDAQLAFQLPRPAVLAVPDACCGRAQRQAWCGGARGSALPWPTVTSAAALRLLGGVSRTRLASRMAALRVRADFAAGEGRRALVAVAVDAHPDGLLDALNGLAGGEAPFVRFQRETVFGEEGAGFFLLDSGALLGTYEGGLLAGADV